MIDKGLDDNGGCPGIVGNLLVGDFNPIEVIESLSGLSQGKLKVHMHGKAQGHDVCVMFGELQGGSVLWQGV